MVYTWQSDSRHHWDPSHMCTEVGVVGRCSIYFNYTKNIVKYSCFCGLFFTIKLMHKT